MTPVSPPTISWLLWEPALGALKIPILDQSSQYSSFCTTDIRVNAALGAPSPASCSP